MGSVSQTRAEAAPVQSTGQEPKPDRLACLDVLRGFDMFWIVGGDGVIHALALATGWQFFRVLSVQMEHCQWQGFHFYDLILPLFLFIVGVAIPYALIGRLERGEPKRALYRKVFKRFILLIALGLIYNQAFHQNWAKPFIGSVLGQIGWGYLIASLIVLQTRKVRSLIVWTLAILSILALIQFRLPVPGHGRGVFTLEGSANAYIDRALNPGDIYYHRAPDGTVYSLGQHPPEGSIPIADAEGMLNWFSVSSMALMGIIAGLILRNQGVKPYRKVALFAITGAALIVFALVIGRWYPIIKLIHTGSYYLLAGGCSFLLLALFYLVIDVWKIRRWGFFFQVIGMNAIALYVGSALVNVDHTSTILVGGLAMYLGAFGPVLIKVVTAALVWTAGYLLYRKKIFVRV